MAIAGLLVHTLKDDLGKVKAEVERMPGLTTYGTHKDQYLVVVAEAPAAEMEQAVGRLEALDGVLTVYTTYLTVEDESEDAGN